jgi:cupin fold WbuC family metalloprotein
MTKISEQHCESPEVFLSTGSQVSLNAGHVSELIGLARLNPRHRVRFCLHTNPEEAVHEMVIVHPKGAYVRPHKHLGKAESMLVLDGQVDYVVFNEEGEIIDRLAMSDFGSGKLFYQSIRTDLYHTLIIRSSWLVFLEITQGPFTRKDTVFASWSPEDSEHDAVAGFMKRFA